MVTYRGNMLGRDRGMVTMGKVHGRGTRELVDSMAAYIVN